ncbi:AMP-binding protein [Sphingomonas canadensis]|uniref:AMP-binding protein n=1 Tax=Sphingomonas canadensis TaxID=1219257 RepID=A0ABW3HBP5_9SPHN|nr:AMP-binding protein [Sphingomonas canadensis]MCW3838139.1 AMP-binding protein [Sphingomonas canadensis]
MSDASLYARIARAAAAAGDRPLLIEDGRVTLAWAELDAATAAWAAALARAGARPGDRIVVQVEKSAANVLLYLAALRAGLVYVPLNTAYTVDELAYFLADADPSVVVVDPSRAEAVGGLTGATVLTLDAAGGGIETPPAAFETVPRAPDDLAAILYTSGTTGRSKGAMLSQDNLASNAEALVALWRFTQDDVLIHALPIYHVHGLFVALHCVLLSGAAIRFHAAFDANRVLAEMAESTVLMGVPTFYVRLAAHPGLTRAAAANMRLFVSGSAPLLESTFAEFEAKTGHRILERYGMTEAGMITSNPYAGDRVPGTVGYPLPGVEARIVDEVLQIRGPNLFKGYWRNPEKTAEDMREGGWFATGDIATMAPDGRVAITGRAKDLIIAGGLNIYPKEIELAIDAIPGIGESAVIGVPHPDLGEAVVAVCTRNGEVDEAEVLAAIQGLARFKQPRRVLFTDALPRNAMGKVQKAELRKMHAALFAVPAAV